MGSWVEIIVAVLGTGVLTTGITEVMHRRKSAAEARKMDAEAEITLSGGYGQLIKELRDDRQLLRKELADSHADNRQLRAEIAGLRDELVAVKRDLQRVLRGEAPLADWFTR